MAPDEETGDSAHPELDCTCPFPILGIYDTLETIELALGSKIPAPIREHLLRDALCHPAHEDGKAAWGGIWAAELFRRAEDGMIVTSFAPTGAEDASSPLWGKDNFSLP